ncbi:MAG: putative glycosyltransferase YkoT [Deltaproteobacteria bacterium]|jgi:glycosyltransferase involved in cell wall biosynthesis|nr:putative glycosyltransferase YkoT [Deltaproteobacteria bacterium]
MQNSSILQKTKTDDGFKLSVIIPCYNEEEALPLTLEKLKKLSNEWSTGDDCKSIEFILVDDGSQDRTLALLTEATIADQQFKVVRFSRNFGHQAALLAGYELAQGDVIVSLDADLQDPPELIETMLEKVKEGYDVIYAARKSRGIDSLFKRKTADFFYWLMKKLGVEIINNHADFRMFTRRVLNAFLNFNENNLFIRATFPIVGFPSCVVYYDRPERLAGETKYPLRKMFEFAIDGLTSFSVIPLRICSGVGLLVSLLALLMLFWSIVVKIIGGAIPGWTSTVAPLYLLGGVQLLFLGIVGEYIGKIYTEVKKRPRYIIQEKINFRENNESK